MQRLITPRRGALAVAACLLTLVLVGAGCNEGQGEGQKSDSATQQSNYDRLVKAQPSHRMGYSPTRETINFWIDTWSKPGKLAYVYLQGANGELLGYYIFKGLPVSYCASQTPTYKLVGTPDDGSDALDQQVPAPSIDGVYYSGGQCNTYYGRDATTNSYIEYTAGLGINVLLYERPLPRQDVKPLGFSTIAQVK